MANSSSSLHLAMPHATRLCSLESDFIWSPSRSIDGRGLGGPTWWAPAAASHTLTLCPAPWTLSRYFLPCKGFLNSVILRPYSAGCQPWGQGPVMRSRLITAGKFLGLSRARLYMFLGRRVMVQAGRNTGTSQTFPTFPPDCPASPSGAYSGEAGGEHP